MADDDAPEVPRSAVKVLVGGAPVSPEEASALAVAVSAALNDALNLVRRQYDPDTRAVLDRALANGGKTELTIREIEGPGLLLAMRLRVGDESNGVELWKVPTGAASPHFH